LTRPKEMIINNEKYIMNSKQYPKYLRGTKSKSDQGNPCPFGNLNPYFEI